MQTRRTRIAVLASVLLLAVGAGATFAQSGIVNLVDPYSDTIVVQAGDLFYVTAIHSAKSDKKLVVDLGDGRSGLTAAIGETIPVKYDIPGEYVITSKLGNRPLGPVTVEVLGKDVPEDVPRADPRVSLSSELVTSVGVSVGSVYAENGKYPMRFAASGECFFQLKRYGYGVVWEGYIDGGDTIIVMDGPDDGESIWTLIKFIDGVQKGGTHVLSPNSPYRLQIEDILVLEGPSYAPVGEYVADDEWLLGTCHEAKLQVVPDPWWAIDPVCGFLYNWPGTDLTDSTGLEKEVDYDDGGVKDVYLICDSDDTGGESTTINSLKIDLDGQEPNENGVLVDVDDGIEADAGVLAVNEVTKLIVRKLGPGIAIGSYRLTWSNPDPDNKKLQFKPVAGGSSWQDSPLEVAYGYSDVEYLIKLKATGGAVWQDTDTVMVTMTHEGYGVTCQDQVKLVPVKVDLDVDADYDGTISVDSPDDPVELNDGGIVLVGSRRRIELREVMPAGTASSAILSWTTEKIKVFDAATDGNEVDNGDEVTLPTSLWVQGAVADDSARDITVTLETLSGAKDEILFTVFDVDSIVATPKGTPDDYVLPDPVKIASGGIESDAHQADVVIQAKPEMGGLPVPISLGGGLGHEEGKDAKLAIGALAAIGGGTAITAETDSSGIIDGVLTSSDVFGGCTINAASKQCEIIFNWDEFDDEEAYEDVDGDGTYSSGDIFAASDDLDGDGSWTSADWVSDPPYLLTPGTSTETLRLRHHRGGANDENWRPLDGHQIRFYVEEVVHEDADGNEVVLTNTADDPNDLSMWASFPDTPSTTDGNGEVSVTLTVEDKPEMLSLTMVAYDLSVWDSPAVLATTVGTSTTLDVPADPVRSEHQNAKANKGDEAPKVQFLEYDANADKYGWDDFTMQVSSDFEYPVKSVAENGTDDVEELIEPINVFPEIYNESENTEYVTVSDPVVQGPTEITGGKACELYGPVEDGVMVNAYLDGDIMARLQVLVLRPMAKTVAVRVVHEEATGPEDPGYSTDLSMTQATVANVLKKVFRQAVMEWDVEILDPVTVDFDKYPDGRDGKIDAETWITAENSEMGIIADAATSPDHDLTIFLVSNPKPATVGGAAWFDAKAAFVFCNLPLVLAHEVGHQLGLPDSIYSDPANVMEETLTAWRLRWYQWKMINNDITNPPQTP